MATSLLSLMSEGKGQGDAIPASTPNVTRIVLISVALFPVIAQTLEAIGAISLSTTQQVTIWLVAAALIVLLSIADMSCRAYLTAKAYRSGEPSPTPVDPPSVRDTVPSEQGPPEPPRVISTDGPGMPTPVPSKDGNAGDDASALQNGPRLPVKMADVFPEGCYLVPASVSETYDYDDKTKTVGPSIDKITGQRVYQCRVVDMDPERKGRSRETVVKIVAGQMPVPPTQVPYEPVEFEGLTAIPFATDRGRVAYTSLCATGIKQAITRPATPTTPTEDAVIAARPIPVVALPEYVRPG